MEAIKRRRLSAVPLPSRFLFHEPHRFSIAGTTEECVRGFVPNVTLRSRVEKIIRASVRSMHGLVGYHGIRLAIRIFMAMGT